MHLIGYCIDKKMVVTTKNKTEKTFQSKLQDKRKSKDFKESKGIKRNKVK